MSAPKASPGCAVGILGLFMIVPFVVAHWVEDSFHHDPGGHSTALKTLLNSPLEKKTVPMVVPDPVEGAKVRTLREFYSRRAYPGAPPVIPHPAGREDLMGDSCLTCHAQGGYVPKYNAFTPLSPHPEKSNCRQCHVPQSGKAKGFVSDWSKLNPPKRGQSAMGGSPPRIPHTLQLRENCTSCHVGPSAVEEIRVSHPERENCQQCHVPRTTQELFRSSLGKKVDGR